MKRSKPNYCSTYPISTDHPGCGMVGPTDQTCTVHVTVTEFDGFTVNWHGALDADGRGRALWKRSTERLLTRS